MTKVLSITKPEGPFAGSCSVTKEHEIDDGRLGGEEPANAASPVPEPGVCPECQGTGVEGDGQPCPLCGGTGKATNYRVGGG